MKKGKNATTTDVTVSEKALISLVSAALKDKVLFPEKVEQAKKYLRRTKQNRAKNHL